MGADTSTLKGAANTQKLAWMSNLSLGYVKKLKERFEFASDDFTLDREALKTYFKCSDRECQILFEHFDMDDNGKIDSYELTCALTLLSGESLEDKAELLFSLYDYDGNKYLSQDELVILMTNVLAAMNCVKKLPPPSIQEIEKKTEDFFAKADQNQDRKITLKEFKDFISTDKEILEVLLSSNMARREDLGTDFGSGDSGVPDVDPDLEAECNPKELQQSRKKAMMKEGTDVEAEDDQEGMFKIEEAGDGDQFMAVKPWLGVVKNSVPTNYKPNPRDGDAPDANLELEYIHGYRCHDARNNLRYTATGEVTYHAAAVGVVLNQKTNTQRFFIQHTDDVHCMAIDSTGKFCATGQIGNFPTICVWNNETMECVARISGTLRKGIKNLAFSPDGRYIAASAFDDEHCIAVYSWSAKLKPGETLKPIATGKGTRANILSLGFNPAGTQLVGTCVKEVNFYTFDNGLIKAKRGTGWQNNMQSVLCQAFLGDTLYTGLFDGNLVQWAGTAIKSSIKAHTDGVHALYSRPSQAGLISGGGDGLIIFWSPGAGGVLQQTKQIDIKVPEVKSMMPKVRSVCENAANGMILVGTRGGEIVEFGGPKPVVLMRSHFEGELWGLATHPVRQEYVTVGQDNVMAIWDIKTRKQKRFGRLEQAANVITYSNSGTLLAVGYINGAFHVLEPDNKFTLRANVKNRAHAISEMKFSADDSLLAVGAHDMFIVVYGVKQNFQRLRVMKGHTSTVTHFDWSLDSRTLMSNCTSYNILFFDAAGTGKHLPSGASAFKNETWASWTCTLGWPVQGIFPPAADGSDINACDRSPEGTVLATADDFGKVKLFRYPCPVDRGQYVEFRGHSSHVTNCRFLKNSGYLISTGGNDKSIFQWKYNFDKESSQQSKLVATGKATAVNISDDIAAPPKLRAPAVEKPKTQTPNVGGMFQIEEVGDGDQAMAIKPFLGQVAHSTPAQYANPKSQVNEKPEGKLELKYAHGFRSFDTRGNLKYINANEIAFSTAALGVVLNKSTNTQKFFNLHEEDVVSMAIHPGKQIIATGQMAAKGKSKLIDIFVWDVSTQEVLARLNNFHRGAIRKLEFSPNGDKLLSIGEDEQNSVAIYDWANKRLLCKSAVDPDKVLDAGWKDETEFVTCGVKHVKFFTLNGINLTMNRGLYGQAGVTATICSRYAFTDKVLLTGGPTGELHIWQGRTLGKALKAHTEALWQILPIPGNQVVTGGNDGKLIIWDRQFAQKQVIDLVPMSRFPAGVRSLDFLEQTKTLLVGTKGAEIIEVNQTNGQKVKTLIHGHFAGTPQAELWGCAVHPKEQLFVSCGADKTIRLWQSNNMVQASVLFEHDLTAIDWSSDGLFIVAGDRNGFIHLVDPKALEKGSLANSPSNLAGKKDAWIEDVKIAPNCQMIAFGTHGGRSFIDLVKVIDGKKLQKVKAVNLGLSSALTHLDWTLDSTTLIINSQAYELMWMNTSTFTQVPASSAKAIGDDYASFTGCFGWQVKGIWKPFSDFTDVNGTCRSHSRNFLATADDFGQVNIYKYPCTVEKGAIYSSYLGHSSHVTKVRFSANDRYLVSTGGHDKTVLIWENSYGVVPLEPSAEEENVVYFEEESKANNGQQNFHIEADDCEDFTTGKTECQARLIKQATKKENKLKSTVKAKIDDVVVDNPFFQIEGAGDGDEFMAIKPWVGQIKAPSDFRKPKLNQNKPPQIGFDLDWVHGYRSNDSRNNIAYIADGSICYPAAGLGIAQDISQTGVQRFFMNHIDDVTAISFSPDKRFVATGEIGPKPMICIWDAITMQAKHVLKGKLTKGIQALSFSPSGKTLAAVAIDPDHSIAVYNVETGALIGFAKGDVNQILDISMKSDTTFATSGIKHFKEWTVGANLTAKTGRFGQKDARHGACQYNGELCLTGAITGELYIWAGAAIKDAKKLHDKPLDAIHVSNNFILTGGKDMKVNVLQKQTYAPLFSFQIEPSWRSICGKVRALCLNPEENKLLVGTLGSEIYQVDFKPAQKQIGAPTLLVDGHYSPCLKDTNEVWGLAVFRDSTRYVTVSDDGYLMIWDSTKKTSQLKLDLTLDNTGKPIPLDPTTGELPNSCKARSVDISPNGQLAAIGFRNGGVRVYSTQNWSLLKSFVVTDNKQSPMVQDLKFSPNGQLLAIACHDAKIYIYDANTLTRKAICKASSSAVTHIDWSIDSSSLHSNDLSYEVLYYNASNGQQNLGGATAFKDEQWATYTVPLGWPSQGIWRPQQDGSDINAVDRSYSFHPDGYQLIASGDDDGKVKLFRYPSSDEGSQGLMGKGHSSHVTNVKFAYPNDQFLFSTGGNDTCVFRWKVRNSIA